MYYLEIISLDGCPYSRAAKELVTKQNINHEIFNVSYEDRSRFKNSDIQTFPQVYLKKKNKNGGLLIGGFDDLNNTHKIINSKKPIDVMKDELSVLFAEEFPDKSILRVIQLFV